MEQHQTVEPPERAPQFGGQLFGVHLPIFNFKVLLRPKKQFFFFVGFQNYVNKTLTDPSFKF